MSTFTGLGTAGELASALLLKVKQEPAVSTCAFVSLDRKGAKAVTQKILKTQDSVDHPSFFSLRLNI